MGKGSNSAFFRHCRIRNFLRDLNEALVIFWPFGMRGNVRTSYRRKCLEMKWENKEFSQTDIINRSDRI